MDSPVSIDLVGVPLRTTLRLMLAQLGLVYLIDEGMLVITHGDPGPLDGIGQADDSAASQEKTAMILARLETPVPIRFPQETPLGEVLRAIKEATKAPDGSVIPIYLDPAGLQLADKTVDSPVTMDVEGLPLRTTLRALLGAAQPQV